MKKKEAYHILRKIIKKNEKIINVFSDDEFWRSKIKAERRARQGVSKVGNMNGKEAIPIIEKIAYVRKSTMFDKHYYVTLEDCRSKLTGNETNWRRIGDGCRKARVTIEYLN